MESCHDLVVECRVTLADGHGERDAAQKLAVNHLGAHLTTIGLTRTTTASALTT